MSAKHKKASPAYRDRLDLLIAQRRAHRVSQFDLADRLDRSVAWLGVIERGERIVTDDLLDQIASALSTIVAERVRRV